MSNPTYCAFCGQELDQGQEFLYRVEVEDFRERVGPLVAIRIVPESRGDPLRMCRECWRSVDENRRDLLDQEEADRRLGRRYRTFMAILFTLVVVTVLLSSRA